MSSRTEEKRLRRAETLKFYYTLTEKRKRELLKESEYEYKFDKEDARKSA